MANHVFICFSSKDQSTAHQVVAFLESHGIQCWISSRDVPPGQNYQNSIVQALEAAKAIVFLFSDNSSKSHEIMKELSLAASEQKAVIPLRLTPVTPSGALRYELATRQWIDAFPDPTASFDKLVAAVRSALSGSVGASDRPGAAERAPPSAPAPSAPVLHVGAEDSNAIRGLLARHVGPIAKVLVQKATNEARSIDDFCDRLAGYVPAPNERAAFRQSVKARLAGKS